MNEQVQDWLPIVLLVLGIGAFAYATVSSFRSTSDESPVAVHGARTVVMLAPGQVLRVAVDNGVLDITVTEGGEKK